MFNSTRRNSNQPIFNRQNKKLKPMEKSDKPKRSLHDITKRVKNSVSQKVNETRIITRNMQKKMSLSKNNKTQQTKTNRVSTILEHSDSGNFSMLNPEDENLELLEIENKSLEEPVFPIITLEKLTPGSIAREASSSPNNSSLSSILEYDIQSSPDYYKCEAAYKADWPLADDVEEKKGLVSRQYQYVHDDYHKQFFKHMKNIQISYMANPRYIRQNLHMGVFRANKYTDYLLTDHDMIVRHRLDVIDWMFEVYDDFHQISHETVHMAISFFDKYLSEPPTKVLVSDFQLVATCALYMASKFIDIYPPSVKEFSRITNYTYDPRDIIDHETKLLQVFSCKLNAPTVYHFLMYYMEAQKYQGNEYRKIRRLSLYFCDLTRVQYHLLGITGEVLAMACIFMGHAVMNLNVYLDVDQHPMLFNVIDKNQLRKTILHLWTVNEDIWMYVRPQLNTMIQHDRLQNKFEKVLVPRETQPLGFASHIVNRWKITLGNINRDWYLYNERVDRFLKQLP